MKNEQFIRIDSIGLTFYFKDEDKSILHREDGPAMVWDNGTKYWYVNGKRHRTDGPAIEYADGSKEWYINDEKLTEEEFNARS